jgi:hypothetical protein
MKRALESSPFTLLAKPCPPELFVETVRRICHDIQPMPEKNKCLPVGNGAQRPTPSREQMHGAKPLTPIKQLPVELDDKKAPLELASYASGTSLHSLALGEGIMNSNEK